MNTTTDWRNLPAGRELDRVIAARAGWKLQCSRENDEYVVRVFDPAGSQVAVDYDVDPSEVGDIADYVDLPAYSASTDAALTLPLKPDMYYSIDIPGETCGAKCVIWNQYPRSVERRLLHEAESQSDTPALAICKAWLALMETKGE